MPYRFKEAAMDKNYIDFSEKNLLNATLNFNEGNNEIQYRLQCVGTQTSECAAIYENETNHYTAAIFSVVPGNNIIEFKVKKDKILPQSHFKIIDINTEKELAVSSIVEQVNRESIQNQKTADEKSNIIPIAKADTTPASSLESPQVKISSVESPILDLSDVVECSPLNLNDTESIKPEGEQEKETETENNYSGQKRLLLNCHEELLESYTPFCEMNDENSLHYWYDMSLSDSFAKEHQILYSGFMLPVLYPYMGYKNADSSDEYPNWIFGKVTKNQKIQYFCYGILGRDEREHQPFLGSTGYVYYRSLKDSNLGYWVMYLNADSGKISLPMKPKVTKK